MAKTLPSSILGLSEQAAKDYVAIQQGQLAAIDEGIAAADAGLVATNEDVAAWVRSWDQPGETPPPKCR